MSEQIDKLLNQKQVAEIINMSNAWMEQQRFLKKGIPWIKIGRSCRYRTSDVQKWINDRLVVAN